MPDIPENIRAITAAIASAAIRSGRKPEAIELVAVSKTHPPEIIREAIDAGQVLFGESRVQEARAKIPLLPSKARWHFIGHLQKNKIRQALPRFELFHGVDSLAIAREMNRIAGELGAFPRILFEINVAGESTKFGFTRDDLHRDMQDLLALDRLQIEGLMTIPPLSAEPEDSRKFFVKLRTLRDDLETAFAIRLRHLSMGMSHDYFVAIEEGATLVRVGTAIFGARSTKAFKASALTAD